MATNDKNCVNLKCLYSYYFLYTTVKYNYLDSNCITFVLLNHIKFSLLTKKKRENFQAKQDTRRKQTLLSVKTDIIISTYNAQHYFYTFLWTIQMAGKL